MSTATATAIEYNQAEDLDRAEYVTIRIGDQLLGIPILTVQDVLGPHKILRQGCRRRAKPAWTYCDSPGRQDFPQHAAMRRPFGRNERCDQSQGGAL